MSQLSNPSPPAKKLKQRKSRKAPSIKAAVITRRVNGQSKYKIASELGITRPTVTAILEESNIEQHLKSYQDQSVDLIPAAIEVYRDRLRKGSETAATNVLTNTIWPLSEKRNGTQLAGLQLNVAIQNLMGQHPQTEQNKAIEVKSTEPATTSDPPAGSDS
jgi:predicted transcriptional regulator